MAELCILGTVGTIPRVDRYLSSALLRHDGHIILFDCGEGTQLAIKKAGFSFKSIDVICLSHLHADHVTGLCGLLLTMGNEGRCSPVTIITVKGGTQILRSLLCVAELAFELDVIEVVEADPCKSVTELCDGRVQIFAAQAAHSVPCLAFSVYIRRDGKFDPQKARELGIPIKLWNELRRNGSIVCNGKEYVYTEVMGGERQGIKVSYITDTRPVPALSALAENSDILICEGMFGDPEKQDRAEKSGHMTFAEAATLAKCAKCEQLVLSHFSPSMPEPEEYLSYATDIFANTVCGVDGMNFSINFKD